MNCKEYKELVPGYIKMEIEGEKRVLLKSHLKECNKCQNDYFSHEKIHYALNREGILSNDPDISTEFKDEISDRINNFPEQKKSIRTKWIWYSAAAILLIGVVIGRFVIPENSSQKYIYQKGDESLSQLIASEDWGRLEIVFSDEIEFNKYSTDLIPIHILLEKLSALQKMGVLSFPIVNVSDQNNITETSTIQNNPQIQISLIDFIRLLEQARLQRSRITLEEVSKLLTKI